MKQDKRRPLFIEWLVSRRLALAFFVLFAGVHLVVNALYGIPFEVAGYTTLWGLCIGFGLAVIDGVRFGAKHKALEKMPGRFPTSNILPGTDLNDRDWQAIVSALEAERVRLEGDNAKRLRDNSEYYTLWVHQVKTPIAALRLLLQSARGLDGALRGRMESELYRIEQYTGMALQYQRLESFSSDLELRRHSVETLVNKTLKACAPLFIVSGLSVQAGPLHGEVTTDEKWWCFVLEQVLTNAAKYTRHGNVRIYTKDDCLLVEDTGIGIAGEDLPRVFERGYTGHTGRQEAQSTGLGLYLCREVCQRLGHPIFVESEKGKGTTVKLVLAQKILEHD